MITLPVIAVVTPVASLAAGNLLLGESAQLGVLSGTVAALAVLLTSAGLVVLARLTTGQPGPVGGQGSSVTLPAFPASGSRSGPPPRASGGAPAGRQSPARRRLRPAARWQLATVRIPVIGGLTVWTSPVRAIPGNPAVHGAADFIAPGTWPGTAGGGQRGEPGRPTSPAYQLAG